MKNITTATSGYAFVPVFGLPICMITQKW